MDVRVKKTRRSIVNAFLQLRSRKPLEKITIKELCALAEVNKSTFYAHFSDVFELSDQLEEETIRQIIANLPHPEYVLEYPGEFTREMLLACISQSALIDNLFSDNRSGQLVLKLEAALRDLIFQARPQYRDDPLANIYLSYAIFGGYYAMSNNRHYGDDVVINALSAITEVSNTILRQRP